MSDLTPARRSTDHQSGLVTWLKLNVLASILVIIALGGVAYGVEQIVVSVTAWVVTLENTIANNAKEGIQSTADITRLQANIVDIDHRINLANDRLTELNNQSKLAAEELKGRLNVIDALGKLTADRSFQPALPPAYQKAPPR